MDAQAQLGNAFFSGLIKLRAQKGSFDMSDVGVLFEQLSGALHPSDGKFDYALKEEIKQLASFIQQAKAELSVIGASDNGKNATGDATLHLDAVIKGTEEASHAIMDAADVIQTAAGALEGENQALIMDAITKIYEACNFQDLTGQRVNKVIKILAEIDIRTSNMLKLFGPQATLVKNDTSAKGVIDDDKKLLNGPQLPDIAPSQDDIDALFGTGMQ